jgi:glutathione S-transferase
MTDMLLLYTVPVSTYGQKVRLAAALMGLELAEAYPPDGYGSAAYKRIVPQGTVPALMHDGFVVAESDVIIEYLDEVGHRLGATRRLLPADPQARARERERARFADLKLELAARALYPLVGSRRPVPEEAIARLRSGCRMLGEVMRPGPFLSGAEPGLADCATLPATAVITTLARHLEINPDLPTWVHGWTARCQEHSRLARALSDHATALDSWAREKQGL